ncbi:MAG: hypothetical protein WCT46_05835, partial [Candidatus Gracilibacteria bacterium]
MSNCFLDKIWLNSHLKQIKTKAGHRYTPKLNVELPISQLFEGVSRDGDFYKTIRSHTGKLDREFRGVSSAYESKELQRTYKKFSTEVIKLLGLLKGIKEYDTDDIPWHSIHNESAKALKISWKFTDQLREEKERIEKQQVAKPTEGQPDIRDKVAPNYGPRPADKIASDIHDVREAQKELRYFESFASGNTAKLSNHPFLLLKGLAGSGKTHLLCDVIENRTAKVAPSILSFGEFFTPGQDVWMQVIKQANLKGKYNKTKLLADLNKAGKKARTRAFLIIDALNETRPNKFWKQNLKVLLEEVKKYPHVALVVSIRSGFEREVFTKSLEKFFISADHQGFQFREWEAVNKFFKEFSLPLPEIPLLLPEFQNPLFLLLFCKAFEERTKKNNGKTKPKQVFRGHEGATYIFEKFIDTASKKIEDAFNIDHGPNKNIWDTVIEKVAEQMVAKNTDRITEGELVTLIKNAHPTAQCNELIKALEKNLILVRVARYSPDTVEVTGFDYRFPFQKFSDHLIGRFIFIKFRASGKTPRQFFAKNTNVGKFIATGWNRGIIEALSIQCPEQLKGTEFFEIAPYVHDGISVESFIESLLWRKPDAFAKDTKKVLAFINRRVVVQQSWNSDLLNAFLSVTAVPNHPFNGQFLHKHLSRFKMPERDSWWVRFLHYQYGEHGAVDRLIEWGWSAHSKDHIQNESIKLYAITLTWFLSSSNRFLRDKATKALASILTERLPVIVELLSQFKTVDDPYILERLYAIAYGCVLRNHKDKVGLKKLARWFLNNIFKKGHVPNHLMMRDYGTGVIETAITRKVISKSFRSRITPPYGSAWPDKIPGDELLKEKYYPEDFFKDTTKDRGFLDIWSSVMYNFTHFPGDFGKYEIDPALGHWSGRRLQHPKVYRKGLFEDFKKTLNPKQLELLNKGNPFFGMDFKTLKMIIEYTKPGEKVDEEELKKQDEQKKKEREDAIQELKQSLPKEQKKHFENEIESYLDDRGGINDPLDRFDTGLGQRWIFNRVVELGWSQKLHGEFDSSVNRDRYDRSEHKAERIGKKYQWIALNELLGLVADNFEFLGDRWSNEPSSAIFEGAWQVGMRDIDPSCTLHESPNLRPDDVPIFETYRPTYDTWKKDKRLKTWLKDPKKLPDPKSVLELSDSKGDVWVVVEGHVEWQEEIPPEQDKYQ